MTSPEHSEQTEGIWERGGKTQETQKKQPGTGGKSGSVVSPKEMETIM